MAENLLRTLLVFAVPVRRRWTGVALISDDSCRVLMRRLEAARLVFDLFNHSANLENTVYPKKYAHGFCFAVLCCGYTLTDFPISFRLTSLALWQSNDCPSASKATLMNMDKYFMWIHYERLHNHNKAKHNKTVCIFLGIYCSIAAEAVVNTSDNIICITNLVVLGLTENLRQDVSAIETWLRV